MLTQVLSGHGLFGAYLHRFRLSDSEECMFCNEVDTPQHTLFECRQHTNERTALEEELGRNIGVDNMVDLMLTWEDNWNRINGYLGRIINTKWERKRELERRNQE